MYNEEYGINLPERTDLKYSYIENYEDYELTHCIVYEMAIRIEQVKQLLDKIEYLTVLKCEILNQPYVSSNPDSISVEEKKQYSRLGIFHINEILDECSRELVEKYCIYPDHNNSETTNHNGYVLIKNILSNTTEEAKYSYISNQVKNEGFTVSQGIYKDDNTYDISYINTNFKRYVHDTNQTYVALNFSLPKDELISYISNIKDQYDTKNSIIKNPLELLGQELSKAEKPKSAKKFPKHRKSAFADAFYIYDLYKILEVIFDTKYNELKTKKNKDIKNIRARKEVEEFDKQQKDDKIEEIQKKYEDINDWTRVSLKVEISTISKYSIDKVEVYLAFLNKYINNGLKYRELLTSKSFKA